MGVESKTTRRFAGRSLVEPSVPREGFAPRGTLDRGGELAEVSEQVAPAPVPIHVHAEAVGNRFDARTRKRLRDGDSVLGRTETLVLGTITFETALTSLTDGDDGVKTILVGGALALFSWLLIPAVFVAGYGQRVLARTEAGEPAHSFDGWGDLFAEGLKAVAVPAAYLAVPAVFMGAVLASLLIFSVETTVVDSSTVTDPTTVAESVTNASPDLLTVLVGGGLALSAVTSLVAWDVLPAALARLAVDGRLDVAFELRKIASVVTDGGYATGWLLALVGLVIGGALVGGLASVPIVGWALAPFAMFYANVVAFVLYRMVYRDSTGTGRPDSVDGDSGVWARPRR